MRGLSHRHLKRPAIFLGAVAVICVAGGLLYSAVTGKGVQKSVAYALFVGGGALVVIAGISGGGAQGARAAVYSSGRYQPADMPFGWVVIGALVIGLGVLVLEA
jgi:hypothetical protein